jgi:hypothetical protein
MYNLIDAFFLFIGRNDQRFCSDHSDHRSTIPETQRRMGTTGIRRIDRRRPFATRIRAQGPMRGQLSRRWVRQILPA